MKRSLPLLATLLLGAAAPPLAAQAAAPTAAELAASVRSAVTPEGLRAQAEAIVRHERPSGSEGENAAIDHIVETLRAEGVAVEVHTFPAYTSDPVSATLGVVGREFEADAITAAFSGSVRGLEAQLVDVGGLDSLPALEVGTGERLALPGGGTGGAAPEGFPDVRGKIALVTGQPRNEPTLVLQRLGAVGVVFVNPDERLNDLIVTSTWGIPSLRNAHRLHVLPVAQVTRSAGEQLRAMLADGAMTVRLTTEVRTGWKPLRLAVATIPAADPEAPFVLFGGHIDAWYHGGTDEGAANAAMVEIARAFHRHRARLRRGLVVAWWPGHSNARYAGSTWYADHFFEELRTRGVAYLNIDGVGQTGARRFGASTTASLGRLAVEVVREREGVQLRPGRPGRNSDQSFNGAGLPLLQINHSRTEEDGGYWWWHTPDDTFDKIDFDVLKRDADLYVDALAALLASPVLPVEPVAEVVELGRLIDERQQAAGERFDLSAVKRRQERLLRLVSELEGSLPADPGAGTDLRRLRVLRPLHRVLYAPLGPYHPDPGIGWEPLPGLAPLRILAVDSAGSDRYRFAETSLVRERNRILEALDEAIRAAEGMQPAAGTR